MSIGLVLVEASLGRPFFPSVLQRPPSPPKPNQSFTLIFKMVAGTVYQCIYNYT